MRATVFSTDNAFLRPLGHRHVVDGRFKFGKLGEPITGKLLKIKEKYFYLSVYYWYHLIRLFLNKFINLRIYIFIFLIDE